MKCNYCEYEVSEDCKCCPNCGENPKTKKKNLIKEQAKKEEEKTETVKPSIDPASLYPIWGLIGFFIPFVGLILFCVWIKTKPKEAKAAGIGALARVMFYIFYIGIGLFFRLILNK